MKFQTPRERRRSREPKPPLGYPRCPTWLPPEAKTVWRRVAPMLEKIKVLTYVDGEALTNYCVLYARWKKAEEFLAKHGDVYPIRDEAGNVKCMAQFPQVAIARNLVHVLKGYQQEFGLTPSARTRVEVNMPTEDDAILYELLQGGRPWDHEKPGDDKDGEDEDEAG